MHLTLNKTRTYKVFKSYISAHKDFISQQQQHDSRECRNTVEGRKFHTQNVLVPNVANHIKGKKP